MPSRLFLKSLIILNLFLLRLGQHIDITVEYEGENLYRRVRSYLSTCRKQGVGIGEALEHLFNGSWPEFIQEEIDGKTKGAE